jgi:hypothetical protein
MIKPINEAMLTIGQSITNNNLRFINAQAEKIIAMTDQNAPQIRNEVVPDPKYPPTQTKGFLHPINSSILPIGDYIIYHNQVVLAETMARA